jgi:hypothetical protein
MTGPTRQPPSFGQDPDPATTAVAPRRTGIPAVAPHQHRLARAISAPANRILDASEELLALSEAVADTRALERAVHGGLWPQARRVALLLTSRRLLEIGLSSSGRRALGRIRSFPWDGIPSFRIEDGWLEVRTWAEDVHRWCLRDVPDPAVERRLSKRVNLAVSTYVPSISRTAPLLHCATCGASRPPEAGGCRHCGDTVRSPQRAAQLAVAAPGAGHLYAQRPLAAAVRCAVELAVFALLAAGVLLTTDRWRIVATVGIGAVVLAVMKLHAAWSAQLLAERAGAIGPPVNDRWRWVVPAGALVSLAALAAPLLLAGALDRDIDWRLEFADSAREWRVAAPPFEAELGNIPNLQEVWSHRDGQWVLVQSWPFHRFEPARRATARVAREWRVAQPPTALGQHRVLEAVGEARAPDGGRITTAVLLVIDAQARDVHVLTTAAEPAGAADRLRQLVARSYWEPARPR